MDLAVPFVVAIVFGMGVLLAGMYAGGGSEAIRRQSGTLAILVLVLVVIAVVVFAAANSPGGLGLIVPIVAGASAVVAAIQARSLSALRPTSGLPLLAIVMWLVAGLMTAIALSSAIILMA